MSDKRLGVEEQIKICQGRDYNALQRLVSGAGFLPEAQRCLVERVRRDAETCDMDFEFTPEEKEFFARQGRHYFLFDVAIKVAWRWPGPDYQPDPVALRDLSTISWSSDPSLQTNMLQRLGMNRSVLLDLDTHPRLVVEQDPELYAQFVDGYDLEVVMALQESWTGSLRSLLEASQLVAR